ncbi:peptide-methionine (S)-S-oxide reductase [Spongiimicrobium sp. 2-473A-2-J]|uniref:peptide-methionine (S)-S-oxide reductase n=1 Tax=Eudoraea algarum TaxID=3417568 RepID=UPI003D36FCF6
MKRIQKIAFGGGCHWCTEAVFLSLRGVVRVQQGFVASDGSNSTFSEAVIVDYDVEHIALETLIAVHLHTHNSTKEHRMRDKYRSAIYTFTEKDAVKAQNLLGVLQKDFEEPLVTHVLPFKKFTPSEKAFHNYYYTDPERPFCTTYIAPKLKLLLTQFSDHVDRNKTGVKA